MGTPCESNADCISGTCSTEGFCTSPCGEAGVGLGCPPGFECEDTRDICVPQIGNLPFGQECENDSDCLSGHCRDRICSRECNDHAPCVGDYECTEEEGAFLCDPKSAGLFAPSGACACTADGGSGAGAAILLVLLPVFGRRRRVRA
jgi:uncharacterized protein (TIGR03382 family)